MLCHTKAPWLARFLATEEQSSGFGQLCVRNLYVRPARHQQNLVQLPSRSAGELPQNIEDLLRIPGVGPYTAGAIASIAFNKRAAVVDGNVVRVFSRLAALTGAWEVAGLAQAVLDTRRSSPAS